MKKNKKNSLKARVSRLEKALEIENSLFKAVAEDFDKTVSKDQEKRDEIVKEVVDVSFIGFRTTARGRSLSFDPSIVDVNVMYSYKVTLYKDGEVKIENA